MKKLIIQQPYIYIYIESVSLHSLVSQNLDLDISGVCFSSFITSGHHVEVSG